VGLSLEIPVPPACRNDHLDDPPNGALHINDPVAAFDALLGGVLRSLPASTVRIRPAQIPDGAFVGVRPIGLVDAVDPNAHGAHGEGPG
jgi:hypothetical protein